MSGPFTIALAPLGDLPWFDPDERLADELREKDVLLATRRDTVFAAEPGTEPAQAEAAEAILADLLARRPDVWRRSGDVVEAVPAGLSVRVDGSEPALLAAARLVQDDLVLMRRGDAGWRLAAAVLCFPSSWSLAEKFGDTLDGIHASVPGYDRMATRMARIFDNLRPEIPVWRLNWSIYPDDRLHHPEAKQLGADWFRSPANPVFVRVERQTLTRLPRSGDILFTIRVSVDPVAAMAGHPDGARLALGLADQLASLDPDQLAYKALTSHRDVLVARLREAAARRQGAGTETSAAISAEAAQP